MDTQDEPTPVQLHARVMASGKTLTDARAAMIAEKNAAGAGHFIKTNREREATIARLRGTFRVVSE